MKTRELLKILQKAGCFPVREAKGSHQVWYSPITHEKVIIPIHPSKEVGTGLEKKIIKTLLGK